MLHKEEIILIFGSMNANIDDRTLTRKGVKTLQYLDYQLNLHTTDLFQGWGELGLSSMVFLPGSQNQFFLTTGKSLFFIDFDASSAVSKVEIPKLRGIHEISIIKDRLWISNTFYDEVICYDYKQNKILQRLKLTPGEINKMDEEKIDPNDIVRVNKFHCNQIFESFEGEEFLLVHHVTGEQIVKKVAQKLIKSQGGGGVLSVDTQQSHRLRLKAPHSVRLVNGEYWVFDSGHGILVIFDKSWQSLDSINLAGWGRGGCYVPHSHTFFAGISAPRRRYLKFLDTTPRKNKVLAINSQSKTIVKTWELEQLEQVNNLYLVDKTFLLNLIKIKPLLDEYAPQ